MGEGASDVPGGARRVLAELHRLPARRSRRAACSWPTACGRSRRPSAVADPSFVPWYQLSILPFVMAVLRYALVLDQGKGSAPEEIVLSRPAAAAHRHRVGDRVRAGGVHGVTDGPGARTRRQVVTGWGRNPRSAAHVVHAANPDELAMAVKAAGPRGAIARGLGASYGDAAMNAGGTVVCSTDVSGLLELDHAAGTARVLAGTSIDDLLRDIVPQGWFVPVTPGHQVRDDRRGDRRRRPRQGPPRHRQPRRPRPLDGAGPARRHPPHAHPARPPRRVLGHVRWHGPHRHDRRGHDRPPPDRDQPAARSTATGCPTSTRCWRCCPRAAAATATRWRGSTCWPGAGRSAARCSPRATSPRWRPARHAAARRRPAGVLAAAHRHGPARRAERRAQPAEHPAPSTSCGTARRRAGGATSCSRSTSSSTRSTWCASGTACTGPAASCSGSASSRSARRTCCASIVEALAEHQIPSPVSVLKYFGEADPGPLSFPGPGWTLTLDVPTGIGGLRPLLDRLDRRVVDVGGRLYLAKESRMRPDLVPAHVPAARRVARGARPHGSRPAHGQRPGPPARPAGLRRRQPAVRRATRRSRLSR